MGFKYIKFLNSNELINAIENRKDNEFILKINWIENSLLIETISNEYNI